MKCPFCGDIGDKVVDSRESREGDVIRRRRQCLNDSCRKRFTSYERIEEIPVHGGEEGRHARTLRAIEAGRRPLEGVREAADQAVGHRRHCRSRRADPQRSPEREISGRELGAHVMSELKKLDQVAYVRFASVYRDFRDVDDFAHEVRALKGHKDQRIGRGHREAARASRQEAAGTARRRTSGRRSTRRPGGRSATTRR